MIEKITKIQNFKIFKDFSWDSEIGDKKFEKDNLIYGWNYSGKTTLSNLFRILENKRETEEIGGSTFEFELEGATKITQNDIKSHNLNIRVFNKEYVEENFGTFKGPKVGPVYISLGEDKAKKIELDEKQKELNSKNTEIENIGQSLKTKQEDLKNKNIDEYKKGKAKDIKEKLDIESNKFTVRELKNKLDGETSLIGNDEEVQKKLTEYNQKDREKINFGKENVVDISETTIQKIKDVISREVPFTEKIEELENNQEKRDWTQKGLHLHKDETKCTFCTNKIIPERTKQLESFFSDTYKEAQDEVKKYRKEVEMIKKKVEGVVFPDENLFLESKREKFRNLNCEQIKNDYLREIEGVIELIGEKEKDITKSISIAEIKDSYTFDLSVLEKLINENNEDINNLSIQKEKLKEELIDHFVEEIRDEVGRKQEEIDEVNKSINDIKKTKENEEQKRKEIKEEIERLQSSTSNVDAGLKQINKCVQEFLGHTELLLQKVNENSNTDIGNKFVFVLKRGEDLAKDLSEGEKTVISFAYFFNRLSSIEGNTQNIEINDNPMKDIIVFIDDPISSFDDQHLSYMAAFVRTKLVGKCKQLFISTHNFTFFDLLREFKNRNKYGRIGKKFFIEAEKNFSQGDERIAVLKELPSSIDEYKNEYIYVFKLIYNFSYIDDLSNCSVFPSIPNAFRKFLETYCNTQYPSDDWRERLDSFIKGEDKNTDEALVSQIISVVDRGSHLEDVDATRPQMEDLKVLQRIVRETLDCVKENSKEHFNCLEKLVKKMDKQETRHAILHL